MLISSREAVSLLRARGVGANSARRALARGLAGPAITTTGATLFDLDAVDELARRPVIQRREVEHVSPRGLFIARVDVDLEADPTTQREWLQHQWELMSPWNLVRRRIEIGESGPLPLVATTGGFVTVGADVVDVVPMARGRHRLLLAEPGEWWGRFERRRVQGGPGRPWELHHPDRPWPGMRSAAAV